MRISIEPFLAHLSQFVRHRRRRLRRSPGPSSRRRSEPDFLERWQNRLCQIDPVWPYTLFDPSGRLGRPQRRREVRYRLWRCTGPSVALIRLAARGSRRSETYRRWGRPYWAVSVTSRVGESNPRDRRVSSRTLSACPKPNAAAGSRSASFMRRRRAVVRAEPPPD